MSESETSERHPLAIASWGDWARQTILAACINRGGNLPSPQHVHTLIVRISGHLKSVPDNYIGEGDILKPFIAEVVRVAREIMDRPPENQT